MEIECSDFIIELLGRRLLTENDVRAFVTAVDAGKIDEFSAFLVSWKADRLARDPEDPARRPTSIADFAARYDAISAAVSKHLANEMLSWLDVATGELKGGRQWQFEIPEVWQVFSILRQRSWDNYRELAEQYSGAKDPEASRQARDLMWVAAIIFALYPDCEDNGTVYGSTEARAALMTRCIREPNTAAFFSDIRKAFSIESEDLLGVTLAEVNALRAHITQEISRCRQVIERGGIHIAIATGVIDDSKIWDFIGSTVEHYIASGELKAWAEELSEEWHG